LNLTRWVQLIFDDDFQSVSVIFTKIVSRK
jgi:hypothetical protein